MHPLEEREFLYRPKTKPRFVSSSGRKVAEICGRTVQRSFIIK